MRLCVPGEKCAERGFFFNQHFYFFGLFLFVFDRIKPNLLNGSSTCWPHVSSFDKLGRVLSLFLRIVLITFGHTLKCVPK